MGVCLVRGTVHGAAGRGFAVDGRRPDAVAGPDCVPAVSVRAGSPPGLYFSDTCAMTSVENRARLVLGNWKMHGNLAENAALLTELRAADAASHCEIGVCVPFPYLAQAASALTGSAVSWGAQDVSAHEKGAYTGEVSGPMLKEFGCRWALAGHSERRTLHGETDQIVADKARAALAAGLTPVVCVGESLADRDAGSTLAVIQRQLEPVLALGAGAGCPAGNGRLGWAPVLSLGVVEGVVGAADCACAAPQARPAASASALLKARIFMRGLLER